MSFEVLHFKMGERERERERKGWRELLYRLTQKRAITALRPGLSGKNPETPEVWRLQIKSGYSGLPRSAPKKITL
jgi:hypothetical protein